jgi:hypothetical protein
VFEGTQAAYLPLYGADDALHVVAEAVAELVAEQMAPNVDDESGSDGESEESENVAY